MRRLPGHLPALDGLRGVAILLVVLTHAGSGWKNALSIVQDTFFWRQSFEVPRWLALVTGQAVHGVTLFFVISAFTLTLSVARKGDLNAYAIRRIARVGPAYWLAGIVYTILAGPGPRLWAPDGVGLPELGMAAVFGSAWEGGTSLAVVPGGWSVSCEVAFYGALPLLLWIIHGRIWRAATLTAVAAVGVQLAARHAMTHGGWNYVPEYIHPLAQAPVFLCGITAALVVQRVSLPRLPGAALSLLGVAIVALPLSPIREWYMLHYLAFAALAAPAVALSAAHAPRLLASAAMRRVGEVSYSMYLVHFAVLAPSLWLAERIVPANHWPTLALHLVMTTGCSFALAALLHRWVETPGIALGRWLIRQLPGVKRAVQAAAPG